MTVLPAARAWIGTPFVHGASARGAGCDCLGLICGLWRETVGALPSGIPTYAPGWPGGVTSGAESLVEGLARYLARAPDLAVVPGRVLVFRMRPYLPAGHLAIATGGGRVIHARDPVGVIEESLPPVWWRRLAALFVWPGGT